MIKKINLLNFGKWNNKSFDLSEITIFSGANEAGKTTIFDAVSTSLTDKQGTSSFKKELSQRYGQNYADNVSIEGTEKPIPEFEFLQFHAIRSEQLSLPDFTEGGKAATNSLSTIKNRIFSGGLDPDTIIKRLEDKTIPQDKRNRNNKAVVEAETKLQELKLKEKNIVALLDDYRNKASGIEKEEDEKKVLIQKKAELENILLSLEEKIALEEKMALKKRVIFNLADIARFEDCAVKEESLKRYSQDEKALAYDLQRAFSEHERQETILREKLKEKTEKAITVTNNSNLLKENFSKQSKAYILAEKLYKELEEQNVEKSTSEKKISPVGMLSCAVLAALAIVCVLLGQNPLNFILSLSSVSLGIILLLVTRKTFTTNNEKELTEKAQKAINTYTLTITDAKQFTAQKIIDALQYFKAITSKMYDEEKNIEFETKNMQSAEVELVSIKNQLEAVKDFKQSTGDKLRAFLQNKACASIEEYLEKRGEYNTIKTKKLELDEKIELMKQEYNAKELFELKARLQADDAKLTQIAIKSDYSSLTMQNYKASLVSARKAYDAVKDELHKNDQKTIDGKARIETGSKGLAEDLIKTRQTAAKVEENLHKIKTEGSAAKLAISLFSELKQDTNKAIDAIKDEASEYFSAITGNARKINFNTLDFSSIEAEDKTNTLRNASHLSRGTKDAICLSLRLALAERNLREHGVYLFDEVFKDLDIERKKSTLKALYTFAARGKRQLIFFTIDPSLSTLAEEVIPNSIITHHTL